MTAFRYRALTADGKRVSGTIDAAGRRDASQTLREQGMHVTEIGETAPGVTAGLRRIGARRSEDTYLFTSHMRRLLRARLPLVEALDTTAREFVDVPMGAVAKRIRDKVAGGGALSEALAAEKEYFTDLYVAMIQAAQASGNLAAAFENIHQYETGRREFRRRLTSAMAYPMVLVVAAFFVVMFLVSYVVPKISETLLAQKVSLPVSTRILMAVGDVARDYWYIVVILVFVAGFSPRIAGMWKGGRLFVDRTMIRLPVVKRFALSATVARFTRTFSALLGTGLRVAEAIDVAAKVAGNTVFEKAVSQARSRVVSGGDLAGALGESGLFPTYAIQVIAVGERTGTLADSFAEIAKAEEENLQAATDRFLTFLEPARIVVMAAVVGFIVASILLPILSMSSMGA